MRMHNRIVHVLTGLMLAGATCWGLGDAAAQDEAPRASIGMPGAIPPATVRCPVTSYAVGWRWQRDALGNFIQASLYCTTQIGFDGKWAFPGMTLVGPARVNNSHDSDYACEPGRYIVGYEALVSPSSHSAHGAVAQAEPGGIATVVDVRPICRDPQNPIVETPVADPSPPYPLVTPDLQQIVWDGVGGPRSCEAKEAVVAIKFDPSSLVFSVVCAQFVPPKDRDRLVPQNICKVDPQLCATEESRASFCQRYPKLCTLVGSHPPPH